MRVGAAHDFLNFIPQCDRTIDARFTLAAQAPFGRRHLGWKYAEKSVAIVSVAKRVLQERKPLCCGLERRVERFEALERVAQTLARNSKVVQAALIAPFEPRGQGSNFSQPRFQHALDDFF